MLCADFAGGTWGYRYLIRHITMHADGADSCRLQTDPTYVYTDTVRRFLDIRPPSQLVLPWNCPFLDCCVFGCSMWHVMLAGMLMHDESLKRS